MHDTLLLFGATGDLAQRYLFPSLLRLQGDGLLPDDFRVRALALSPHDTEKFHAILRERFATLGHYAPSDEQVAQFLARVDYRSVDMRTPESVADAVRDLVHRPCVSYLSIPPGLYISTCEGLALGGAFKAPNRLMLEKPIGHDLESAREINATIGRLIDEDRIFRIDHYLGKAAVQNLLALRFGNTLLEAVWNRTYIDSVNILVSETEGVDGRNAYYARSGALRDMVQSHILQLLCLVAMEPPASLAADRIRDEKVKVLRALRPFSAKEAQRHSLRGRYIAGMIDGAPVQAYAAPDDSDVETYVGVTAHIDNWRWSGVPFFLRTGKRLGEQRRLLTIAFREPPRRMFREARAFVEDYGPDHISFDLGDPGGITTRFLAKVPGPQMRLGQARMEFTYQGSFGTQGLEPYERLMYDAMLGDRTLFTDAAGIESLWAASSALIDDPPPLHRYAPGSYGPQKMHELIAPRRWWLPEA
jgi:glucose-6-phosphate 1-dehydrogenase